MNTEQNENLRHNALFKGVLFDRIVFDEIKFKDIDFEKCVVKVRRRKQRQTTIDEIPISNIFRKFFTLKNSYQYYGK